MRLDIRGHGGSDVGSEDCTVSMLAQDVTEVLDFLNLRKVHFVGVSIGGMIGQALAIEYPARVLSLMLCGTAPVALKGRMEKLWIPRFEAIARAGSLEPIADATMHRWLTESFTKRQPVRWREIHEMICRTPVAGYRGGARAIDSFDVLAQLRSIFAPTLVVCGDGHTGTPPEENRRIAQLIPGARYIELENVRHIPMVEYPELFARIILDWLKPHHSS